MNEISKTNTPTSEEVLELKNRLEETEETLYAIRKYLVDAFVVNRSDGTHVVTLRNADLPYRRMVEAMNEGAVTLTPEGTILYSNPHFCEMVHRKCEQVVGIQFQDLILPAEREAFNQILAEAGENGMRGEFSLQPVTAESIPVQLSVYELASEDIRGLSIIATDLTERVQAERKIRVLASALTKAEQVERHRISQILHDDLQQRLFAIKAQLSLLTFEKEADVPPSVLSVIEKVQKELSNTISITRSLSIDLSPAIIHGEGLADAIIWLSSQMKEQFDLQVEVESRTNLNGMEDHIRVLLFRAVRELLFNIVKHAETKQATVHLEQVDNCLHITVSDPGVGFDVATVMADSKNAHGLLVIQNRLSLLGGKLELASHWGEGTRAVIEIPMEANPV